MSELPLGHRSSLITPGMRARKKRAGLLILDMLRANAGEPVSMETLWALMPDGNHSASAGLHWIKEQGIRLREPGFAKPKVMLP